MAVLCAAVLLLLLIYFQRAVNVVLNKLDMMALLLAQTLCDASFDWLVFTEEREREREKITQWPVLMDRAILLPSG